MCNLWQQFRIKEDFEAYLMNNVYLGHAPIHHHDFYEMFFLLSGEAKYVIEGVTYDLMPGDIILISPTELHQCSYSLAEPYRRIVIYFTYEYILSAAGNTKLLTRCFTAHKNHLRLEPAVSNLLMTHAINIAKEFAKKDEYSKIMADALLVELLVSINRFVINNLDKNTEKETAKSVLAELVDYINSNLSSHLSLDWLADKFYISKYYLIRIFKTEMGITPHRYITLKRLILAKSIMYSGTKPIDTYQACGFTDYSSFYTAFKKEYGMSPKHFYNIAKTKNKGYV